MNRLGMIRSYAEKIMDNSFDHGFPHVLRVKSYAYMIVEGEGLEIDDELLLAGIYLHDIGRRVGEPHAYYSAILAKPILSLLGYSREFVEKVINMILSHSYSYSRKYGVKPLTVEARVLSDADKLDALGVIGFTRVVYYSARKGRSIEDTIKHIYSKLYNLEKLLYYDTSQRIAGQLMESLKKTTNELISELDRLGFRINID